MQSSTAIVRHTLPRPDGLRPAASVIDVGAGIRPVRWYPSGTRHVCVEAFGPYAEVLEGAGYEVVRGAVPDALRGLSADAVVMLDVIEHLDKADGFLAVALAQEAAVRQVVVYTPVGFVAQEHDAWGMGGERWQTHRSGWTPDDFPGWAIEYFRPKGRREPEGFYALLDR